MKDSPLVIIMVIVVAIACIVWAPRILATWSGGSINLPAPQPSSTSSAGNAAAQGTMVAQQQSAVMTAEGAAIAAQATAQASMAQATHQAAEAERVRREQEAARQTDATAQVVQATADHEKFVATMTSAAEATRMQATLVAATATQQTMDGNATATVAAEGTREAVYTERVEEAATEREELGALFTDGLIPFVLFGLLFNLTVGPVLGLLCILLHLIQKKGEV